MTQSCRKPSGLCTFFGKQGNLAGQLEDYSFLWLSCAVALI